MDKIEKLTPEQEALLPEYRDKWLKIGLATGKVDRDRAELGTTMAYELRDVPSPKQFIWFDSPIQGCIASAIIRRLQQSDMKADHTNGTSTVKAIQKSIEDDSQERKRKIFDAVYDVLYEDTSKRESVWALIDKEVTGKEIVQEIYQCGYGSHDAAWLGCYDFIHTVLNQPLPKLQGLWELAHCGWWWPFENIAILTERPTVLHLDEDGRLHCEDGPAIAYPDEWGVYAWHGVRVKKELIEDKENLSVETIKAESNAEVRRVMIEIYGYGRYIEDTGAKLVAEDNFGKLWRQEDALEPIVVVEVLNSTAETDGTRKRYFIPVPPDMSTPHEAVAWTFGLTPEEYQPTTES